MSLDPNFSLATRRDRDLDRHRLGISPAGDGLGFQMFIDCYMGDWRVEHSVQLPTCHRWCVRRLADPLEFSSRADRY